MNSRRDFLRQLGVGAGAAAVTTTLPIIVAADGTVSAQTDPAMLRAAEARQLIEQGLMSEDEIQELMGAVQRDLLCPDCGRTPVSTIVSDVADDGAPLYRNTCDAGHEWVMR